MQRSSTVLTVPRKLSSMVSREGRSNEDEKNELECVNINEDDDINHVSDD